LEIRNLFSRWKWVIVGVILLWGGSIAFALKIKTLLTPSNYPLGSDPSFDIVIAAFFFLLCPLGALLTWRGILDRERRWEGKVRRNINFATFATIGLLILVLINGGLLLSANLTFLRQYQPSSIDEPRPDYSFPAFPTPFESQPTPTDVPGAKFLVGSILSSMDSLRVGQLSISLSPTDGTIASIQFYIYRIRCSLQSGGTVTNYAVDASKLLMRGPIQVQDGDFYASQGPATLHGILADSDQAHGTLSLRYADPATGQACDLGSFYWSAAPVTP
jgi:hypothetical protein